MKRPLLVAVLCIAACATDEHAEERRDSSRWDDLAHGLAAVTSDYCAAEPWSQASCGDMVAQHVAVATGSVDEISAMAGRVDEHMGSLGHAAMADGGCTADALLAEFDRHAAAACAGSTADAEAEARRHCTTVLDLTAQMHIRSDVALQSMTTIYYSGSGSMRTPHRTSAGSHDWPWAASEQPTVTQVCPATP